ncbi:MAG: hypothetical protein O3B76_08990, partial [Proteobacteria bacterium]|nr:hypothetical protein [Pseudomonadota bacterium]
ESKTNNQIESYSDACFKSDRLLGRVKELSARSAAIHLDQPLDEGTQITIDIEDLGSFSGHVSGAPRDGVVPIIFDIDEKDEDHLIAEIMKIYNNMALDK